MKDVRIVLAQSFEALKDIAKDHNIKAEKLEGDELNALISDIAKLEELVQEAKRRAAGHVVATLYAIGKETAPGEYAGFTHGPTEERDDLMTFGGLEDGDALVRIQTGGGIVNYLTEYIWLDGSWNATEDETPKEATA